MAQPTPNPETNSGAPGSDCLVGYPSAATTDELFAKEATCVKKACVWVAAEAVCRLPSEYQKVSVTYQYTGTPSPLTLDAAVDTIEFVVYGGDGGNAWTGAGGKGAGVASTIRSDALRGATLYVDVGRAGGSNDDYVTNDPDGYGGYGAGSGGKGESTQNPAGSEFYISAGGGGATSIYLNSLASLNNR